MPREQPPQARVVSLIIGQEGTVEVLYLPCAHFLSNHLAGRAGAVVVGGDNDVHAIERHTALNTHSVVVLHAHHVASVDIADASWH